MTVYYFHVQNGTTIIENDGFALPSISALRAEAIETIAAILREDNINSLWNGMPLRIWVTEVPDRAAKPVLDLQLSVTVAG